MSQAATYPRNDVFGNRNAPYPQNQGVWPVDPYGTVPQGYPFINPPVYETKEVCENPCECCCGLLTAAQIFAILNLFYLALEIFAIMEDMIGSQERGEPTGPVAMLHFMLKFVLYFYLGFMTPGPDEYADFKDEHFLYVCKDHETHAKDWSYILTLILIDSSILAYLVATIGFMVAVVCRPGLKFDLLWSNIYMWTSFIYAGTFRLLLLIQFLIIRDQCEMLIAKFILMTVPIVIHSVINGLLARGFRIMVERESGVEPQVPPPPPGIAEDVQASWTRPVAEPIHETGESFGS